MLDSKAKQGSGNLSGLFKEWAFAVNSRDISGVIRANDMPIKEEASVRVDSRILRLQRKQRFSL